ncbi:hypothetical protein NP233_g11306 [Leucocoprinus birnbaumii]|uniref:Uncharacterized protein n=1 Tax=Leucocoprinus birnbaumii TaxID=56174 RepID=A0AAD5YKJ3_9AGAR|nr:hypothetical protein NP233_g11306 [Leucocoprinus birnbaumii]
MAKVDLNPFFRLAVSTLVEVAACAIASGFTGASQATSDHLERAWKEVQAFGPEAERLILAEVAKVHSGASDALIQLRDAAQQVAIASIKIQNELKMHSAIILTHLVDRLPQKITETYEDLKGIVTDPLPEERSERARGRAQIAKQIIDRIGLVYIQILTGLGFPRKKAVVQFDDLGAKLLHVISIIGNIRDEHPALVQALIFFTLIVVLPRLLPHIPNSQSIVTLLGFGPLGPIEGSFAAWAQRALFGAAVGSDNWFASLQSIGTTGSPNWLGNVVLSAVLTAVAGCVTRSSRRG